MTVLQWQAGAIERAAENFAFWLGQTQADRLAWSPVGENGQGRCALEQAAEVARVNRTMAAILGGTAPAASSAQTYEDVSQAQKDVRASGRELAAVMRTLDDAVLERRLPWGNGTMPGLTFVELPLTHMNYHAGQINYIQCLYGDHEFVIPPVWEKMFEPSGAATPR